MEGEQLTQEQLQEMWDEEANVLDSEAGDDTSPEQTEDQGFAEPQESDDGQSEQHQADPFEGLPEVVKERLKELEDLKQTQAQLLHHIKTTEGRVAAMQREADMARRAQQAAGNDAPSQKQIATAAKNPEKWEQLKQDFPEWATAMEEFVAVKLSSVQQGNGLLPADKVAEIVTGHLDKQIGQTRAEFTKALEEAKVEGKYEDWRDVVKSQDFVAWFKLQASDTQKLAESPLGRDAIKLLDLYEKAKAKPASEIKQERGQRLAAAASTRPGVSRPVKTLDNMTSEELWNYEAQQLAKKKAERGY